MAETEPVYQLTDAELLGVIARGVKAAFILFDQDKEDAVAVSVWQSVRSDYRQSAAKRGA